MFWIFVCDFQLATFLKLLHIYNRNVLGRCGMFALVSHYLSDAKTGHFVIRQDLLIMVTSVSIVVR